MIVRVRPDVLQLITQPDHAQLARRIMDRCVPLAVRPRRDWILHAIGEHDSGWAEEDAEPTVNPASGEVADFVHAPLSVRHRIWPRAVARLAKDPWTAALVAQHALTIYERFREDAEWTPFFAGMETARDSSLGASKLPPDELLSECGNSRRNTTRSWTEFIVSAIGACHRFRSSCDDETIRTARRNCDPCSWPIAEDGKNRLAARGESGVMQQWKCSSLESHYGDEAADDDASWNPISRVPALRIG